MTVGLVLGDLLELIPFPLSFPLHPCHVFANGQLGLSNLVVRSIAQQKQTSQNPSGGYLLFQKVNEEG